MTVTTRCFVVKLIDTGFKVTFSRLQGSSTSESFSLTINQTK